MKLLLILIILILSPFSGNLDCSDLKNGKYKTTNDDGSITVITRKGKKQIESFRDGERVSEFDVKWTNDCEYLIYNRKVISGVDPWPEMNSDTLRIKIIEITDNFYFTESEMISRGWKMNQKVQIIK